MQSFKKPSTRVVLVTGIAGAALIGAVAVGGAAFADSAAPTPSPSGSASAPATPGTDRQRAHQPHIGGEVLTVSGSTVTVKDRDGFTRTIELAADATITKDGTAAQASAITVGAHVEARGAVAANGTSLRAAEVTIGQPAGPGRGGAGPDGRRGPDGAGRPDGKGPGARGGEERPTPGAEGTTPSAPAPSPSAPGAGS